jgi:hypothetical protein
MIRLRSIFCLLFVAWMSVSAGSPDVRRQSGQRIRMARSLRLELDHHSDLSHEGESHSVSVHYEHHQSLERLTGTAGAVSAVLDSAGSGADAVLLSATFPVPLPAPAFDSRILGVREAIPVSADLESCRGRAPPLLSL